MNVKVIRNHVMVNVQLENDIALNMEWSALSHAFDLFKKKSFSKFIYPRNSKYSKHDLGNINL